MDLRCWFSISILCEIPALPFGFTGVSPSASRNTRGEYGPSPISGDYPTYPQAIKSLGKEAGMLLEEMQKFDI